MRGPSSTSALRTAIVASSKRTECVFGALASTLIGMATNKFFASVPQLTPWLYVGVVLALQASAAVALRAWTSFRQPPMLPSTPIEGLLGNAAFAVAGLVLGGPR
jgi:hypothetical protein